MGRKCFSQTHLVGHSGDDRIRATRADDVIITLGGNDVVKVRTRGLGTTAQAPATTESSTKVTTSIRRISTSALGWETTTKVNDPVRKVGMIRRWRRRRHHPVSAWKPAVVAPAADASVAQARGLGAQHDLSRPKKGRKVRSASTWLVAEKWARGMILFDNVQRAFGGLIQRRDAGTPGTMRPTAVVAGPEYVPVRATTTCSGWLSHVQRAST